MASLVLSGDTSGSITVSAPAVAGSTTQTLVNVSGTLAPIVSGTAVTASGTSVDFTGIPSWVKRITVMLNGVSTAGNNTVQAQIGTSSGIEATGYGSSMSAITNATPATVNSSTGFVLSSFNSSGFLYSGIMTIATLGNNIWVSACNINDTASTRAAFGSGSKTLTGTLDRVRITINGTDTFDAGTINILYE